MGQRQTARVDAADLVTDAIDLVRARMTATPGGEAELLVSRGLMNGDESALLRAQTQVAAMLVRVIAEHEGRSPESVLDSLAVAVIRLRELNSEL